MPPSTPPTTAVLCFSLLQTSALEIRAASSRLGGEPVDTAEDMVDTGDDIVEEVCNCRAPMDFVVNLGAVVLLQQLRRSLIVLQQYVPKSHVWIFHAATAVDPAKLLFTVTHVNE